MSDHDSEFENEINKIKGNIITIMGVPNDKSPEAMRRLVNELSETALNNMQNVEVAELTNVPVVTASVIHKHAPDDFDENEAFMNTPIVRAASCIMAATFENDHDEETLARQAAWDALSEEEKEEEIQRRAAFDARMVKESNERTLHEMQEAAANAFDVAEKWAKVPDLSVREVAHGVAHDMHSHYSPDFNKLSSFGGPVGNAYPTPSASYQTHYDGQFTSEIKNRTMRSAEALFGKKG